MRDEHEEDAAGATAGGLQTWAANPNAGIHEYAFSVGLGGGFGALMPYGSFGSLGGTIGGARIGAAFGDARMGAQVGGLVGGIAGGGWQYGLRAAAWEAGGALIGAGAGYGYYGDAQGALFGANLGMFAGGIARGLAGRVGVRYRERCVRAARSGASRATGAGMDIPDDVAEVLYRQIRATTGDVSAISRNSNMPEHMINSVKQHIFYDFHDIAVGPGQIVRSRFTAQRGIADLWNDASAGVLQGGRLKEFERLIAHEYVELALMKSGVPFRSIHPSAWIDDISVPNPQHWGAHDYAPLVDPNRAPWAHHEAIGF